MQLLRGLTCVTVTSVHGDEGRLGHICSPGGKRQVTQLETEPKLKSVDADSTTSAKSDRGTTGSPSISVPVQYEN